MQGDKTDDDNGAGPVPEKPREKTKFGTMITNALEAVTDALAHSQPGPDAPVTASVEATPKSSETPSGPVPDTALTADSKTVQDPRFVVGYQFPSVDDKPKKKKKGDKKKKKKKEKAKAKKDKNSKKDKKQHKSKKEKRSDKDGAQDDGSELQLDPRGI
jgi:hypothetical protein